MEKNVPNYQGYKIYPFLSTLVVKYLNREKRGYKIPRFLSGVQDSTAGTMSSDCFRCTLSNVIKRIRAVGVHCKDLAKPLQRLWGHNPQSFPGRVLEMPFGWELLG